MSEQANVDKSGAIAALLGGGLLVMGPFLPWVSLGLLSASGIDKTGSEALVFTLLGLIALVAGGQGIGGKSVHGGISTVGVIAGLLLAYYVLQILDAISGAPSGFSPSMGAGVYVTGLGAILVAASPFLGSKAAATPTPSHAAVGPCPRCSAAVQIGSAFCPTCGLGFGPINQGVGNQH